MFVYPTVKDVLHFESKKKYILPQKKTHTQIITLNEYIYENPISMFVKRLKLDSTLYS